jgi:hypothetical protein
MKQLFLSAFIAALPLLTFVAAATPPTSGSIQGTWKTVEVTLPGPNGRVITNLQPNLTIVSAKHYSRVEEHSEGPRPVVEDIGHATADELRSAWGPFVAEAGTYELSGNIITMRPIVAKNPAAMMQGRFSAYSYRLVGDTLFITAQRTDKGPADALKVKAIRVE